MEGIMDKKKEKNPDGIQDELETKAQEEVNVEEAAAQLADNLKKNLEKTDAEEKADETGEGAETKAGADPEDKEPETAEIKPEESSNEETVPKEESEASKTASTLEARELEVARREAELNQKVLEADAKKLLQERDLPEELLPFVVKGNIDETKGSIEALAKIIASMSEKKLTEAMKGTSPSGDKGNVGAGTATMEQIIEAGLRG